MARPSYGYRDAAGKKLPGVTTILGVINPGGSSDFLIDWGAKLAKEGKSWREERQKLGDHGTALHDLCEHHLPNDPVRPEGIADEQWEKLLKSYQAIAKWWLEKKPNVLVKEEPLVSERYRFGGTLDGLCELDGEPWLYDFKSGSQVGVKEVCQMAAYRELLDEVKKVRPVGAILIHAPSKEPGYMRPVILTKEDLDAGWQVFGAALGIYRALPELRKVCE